MSDTVLNTRAVCKKYGETYALSDVSIHIKRGQIYGLIGLNGAGKSTFMRIVAGLVSPTGGEVELFGQTGENALRKNRRRLGQCIETPALYPGMTARENLEIQCIVSGVSDKTTVQEMLALVGLSDTDKKKAKNFSLGMKQRLALAIAMINHPDFLILDEPANGLDPMGIVEMRELMRRLSRERGLTILVSSHMLDELAQVATHYGIIDRGRLVKQLSEEELALESRQYVRIVTTDAAKAAVLLSERFALLQYKAVSPRELHIFEQIERTGEMNKLLVENGFTVERIGATEQRLEDYFMKLTGGRQG